jgi:hypothetical protein
VALRREGSAGAVSESGGFCCNMGAMSREERGRYEELRGKLEGAVVAVEELENGYSLRFDGGAVSGDELAEWIVFERKCCPFFTLAMARGADALVLRITGEPGVKEFIRAEFGAIRFA